MTIIKNLAGMIGEEIADSCRYADCANLHKDSDPQLAETFFRLSLDEMQHMQMLHDQVVRIIADYKRNKGDPPPAMMAVYDYLHEQHVEKAGQAKAKQMLYKGS